MKQQLREQILYKRMQLPPEDQQNKSAVIIEKIETLPEFQQADQILMYMAIHGEVTMEDLFKKHNKTKEFILPRVDKNSQTLKLYHITSLKDLVKGSMNILEPMEHLEQVEPSTVDLAIIPAVAFTKDGHRIGYGSGFYDRLLTQLQCPKIGVAYDFQIVENMQAEEHDMPVDKILTETQIIER